MYISFGLLVPRPNRNHPQPRDSYPKPRRQESLQGPSNSLIDLVSHRSDRQLERKRGKSKRKSKRLKVIVAKGHPSLTQSTLKVTNPLANHLRVGMEMEVTTLLVAAVEVMEVVDHQGEELLTETIEQRILLSVGQKREIAGQ